MTYVLGINAFHGDSSAAIYKGNTLLVATEEERILRIKHWAGLPVEAIKFCLQEAGITILDVDAICVSRDPKVNIDKKIKHLLKNGFKLNSLIDRIRNRSKLKSFVEQLEVGLNLTQGSLKVPIINVEHHLAHLASAYNPSPFTESALLSIDGMGDFTSTKVAYAHNGEIRSLSEVNYPHSLGIFYTAFTQFLGFPHYGDEYKVMGLAPYGEPTYLEQLNEVITYDGKFGFTLNKKYFLHFKNGVDMNWDGGIPEVGRMWSDSLSLLFGTPREKEDALTQVHYNIAASVQRKTEEIIFKILTALHAETGSENLCIAGGVAQNSVANGKILKNTPFKNLFVPPAGHDAGTAAGSALYYLHQMSGVKRKIADYNPYTGYQASPEEIETCLKRADVSFENISDDALFEKVCDCIISGGVVGWYQGRAEFGPRALGHRSILADPRRNDVKEILNLKIKRRESFRPFAPSILKEYVDEYFDGADFVPFMEKVYPIKKEKHAIIPAVTHVDGTGRLQSVDKNIEPKYHALITRFYEKTGVPILVNTSFNENEPIVNRPEEALNCFLRTKMDMLVMGNYVVKR